MGTAEMELEIIRQIRKLVQDNKHLLEDQTGISSSLTTQEAREYTELIITEVQGGKSQDKRDSK